MLYSIFKFNSGEIRLYIFIGILFGVIIYMLSISKFFVKINLFVIEKIKQIFKPISFVIINVRKILSKISLKMEYLKKNKQINKKCHKLEGFLQNKENNIIEIPVRIILKWRDEY